MRYSPPPSRLPHLFVSVLARPAFYNIGALPSNTEFPNSAARGISPDGSVVVGNTTTMDNAGVQAAKWTIAGGLVPLGFSAQYLNLTGWTLDRANGLSADGSVIVGEGYDPQGNFRGWVAVVPEPASMSVALPAALLMRKRRIA